MAHLPSRSGLALAVEMQLHARQLEGALEGRIDPVAPELAEEIRDRRRTHDFGRAERQVAHGAHELLELARDAGRLARVIAVVRSGRELVDQQTTVLQEKE